MRIDEINIRDYNYPLEESRIAKYPLSERDSSKLLVYSAPGKPDIAEDVFRNVCTYLPSGSMMVVNDTKVVPARLFFRRETGARIEIFCLKPISPSEYSTVFNETGSCVWMCVIGNSKRWKDDSLFLDIPDGPDFDSLRGINLRARLLERNGEVGDVEFRWDSAVPFSTVLELCGQVPIPPYLNRGTEEIDVERYQTLYAQYRGSVAAPTAGLHFTERVLQDIRDRGIDMESVCLHVGAGTFLPVKTEKVSAHVMHREPFVVKKELVLKLLDLLSSGNNRKLIAVGTTSVRTLESLYYVGVNCIEKGVIEVVPQWCPYEREYPYTTRQALQAILDYMTENSIDEIQTETRIIIVPGFRFRLVDVLITNFHQPESTLILLVSAFVKGDWRRIYDYALDNSFRFLSYGDSSLLFRKD